MALLLAASATASNAQSVKVAFDATPPVPTELATLAFQALQKSSDMDGCTEYAGLIIQKANGSYRVTEPVAGSEDHFELRVAIYRGEKLAAIYHTHPLCLNKQSDQMFSPDDIATAIQLNVPSFIWVAYDNTLRLFIPHVSPVIYVPKIHDYASYGMVLGHTECHDVGVRLNMAGFVVYKHICRYW